MNILLIGSGGREHALAWKMYQSPKLTNLFITPGNAGTDQVGENVNLNISDFAKLKDFLLKQQIDIVVVGPENPLVEGITDKILGDQATSHITVIGPDAQGAMLEGSKEFAKKFMQKHDIPTADYQSFDKSKLEEAKEFLRKMTPPYVLKADGLAAGKGVIICNTIAEAEKSLEEMLLEEKFGKASAKVVIEEFLDGIELSVFTLSDGHSYLILPEAKDYKRIGEGDTGLNTGGMGSISPVSFADKAFMSKIEKKIIQPTINGLKSENIDYKGFLFFGLIKVNNEPYVIEYNVRMGDPESQSVIPRIKTDLVDLFQAVGQEKLFAKTIEFNQEYATTVVLVSGGYPEEYSKGKLISEFEHIEDCILFHMGTKKEEDKTLTNGGRVIAVTSLANTMQEALSVSYKNANSIQFEGKKFRSDIGFDLKGGGAINSFASRFPEFVIAQFR